MESLKDVQGVNYVFSPTSGEVTGGTVSFKRKKKRVMCFGDHSRFVYLVKINSVG